MLKLPGYNTLEKIHEGKYSLIYRADTEPDKRPVIFKTVNSAYPPPEEINRLKREFEITSRFQNSGVIQALELTNNQNSPVLILEDFGGVALARSLAKGPLEVSEFLSLAVRLAEILGDIHDLNIIHKDINPGNIVWNREKDIVKIIDFGISLELSREVPGIKNPNVLEGTLAYISPEQTGRMNRFLDYRTDYYSLGITFYHMLAGYLPFESADAMEMVYAHIAREAPSLHELNTNIPRAVCNIIRKLIAKNVEDRYQSANGLASDLKRCQEEFLQGGIIDVFTPGQTDVSDRLQIPQKLFGREDKIASLLTAFERAGQGARELLLVAGLPGIGKSALVNEIQKPIVKLRGNFIAGKYDKFKKDVPYSALLHAFSALVKHLLAENAERLADWKDKILKALGPNGRVITNVIPELELVIGPQPEISILGPEESRNRFNLYFQFFIQVFCKAEHPLVLFLDDLQWADHASLEMMKLFLSDPDITHLFVIGAYRNNEVEDAHSLNLVLDEISKTGTTVNTLSVTPLEIGAIIELLRESLRCDTEKAKLLGELVLRKTGGNPFFLGEFLKTLYQNKLLVFNPGSGWTWDIHEIEALQVTDNVVELMAAKIEQLPENCGDLLKLAACFGNYFELEKMNEIAEKSESEILAALKILLEEGLFINLESNYKFAHDRIQEAAYSLLSESERIKERHRIGHLELKRNSREHLSNNLFYIVNHLNAARQLVQSEPERMELARLNLQAGIKARSSAAYRPALNYLDIALGLLPANCWENDYEVTLIIYQEAAAAAFLCSDYKRMDELGDTVIQNARNSLDTIKIYEAKIFSAAAQSRLLQAVQIGLMVLRNLGVRLPENPGKHHILFALLSVKWTLLGKSIAKLEKVPELKDPKKLAIARILTVMGSSSFLAMPALNPLLIFKMLKLSIKYGKTSDTPYSGYASYGLIQCGVLGDMQSGYEFGQLALRLMESFNTQDSRARTMFVMQVFIKFWKEPLRNTLKPLKEGLRFAMENGDPEFACHTAVACIEYAIFCGRELTELEKDTDQYKKMIGKLNQLYTLYASNLDHQLILNLQGHAENPAVLKGESYDSDKYRPGHLEAAGQTNIFRAYCLGAYLSYLFGQYEDALKRAQMAEPAIDSMMASFYIPMFNFYKSLSQLSLYPDVEKSRKRKFLRNVARNQKKMKHWANHAPMNFEHKYRLVEAEKARVLGKELKAREHYEQAILGARENRYINEEALALELFAKFWLELGKEEIAGLYMDKARQAYRTWGALAKVKYLEDNYPDLTQTPSYEHNVPDAPGATINATTRLTITENKTTERTYSGKLDLTTVMKGSQAISGEIVLGNLLRKMIKIVMENAGARSGYLILENHDKLYVEAAGELETDDVTVLQSRPLDTCEGLSAAVVQYAARTKENVVLNDAANVGPFIADPHIATHKPRSILCAPVLNQGRLSAILYLENNLSAGAFTADRLEVLNMLSSQIAVSIDNARLYANLEEKVQERTAELQDTLGQVQALKTQQDGDYYLTSMLINPLARNEVKSERVTVDFLVEQKKQFKFKKWEEELGGDLCIAHNITLENTTHTIFLNADAMGKSMQGAGGALVLGAVFQSIIERTMLDSFDESQAPATWLRNVILELQKVFESFDGRMLISLVLGAVNEATGALNLINADHPLTVLYRRGIARFIERDLTLHKLGMPMQANKTPVYRLQLKPGDVLIAGSDGRDDILFSENLRLNPEKRRIINEDETEFLKRVMEGQGFLPEIKGALLEQGEFIDDLSLIRLEYI